MQLYTPSLTSYQRLKTREVKVGKLLLGNNNPIRIQTMTTTDTMDTMATVEQSIRCIEAGAELVRITAPSKKEAENYIKRLKDIPRFVNENLALMRRGLQLGIDQPKAILDGYQNTYEQHIVTDAEKSIFYKPFLNKPFNINDADWAKITADAKAAVLQYAVESFKTIKTFFDKEYLPKTRTTIGVSNFPDGLAYYQDRTHHYTTTDMTYEEVYQLGLSEVARIKKEMLDVIKEVNFNGTFQEFITYLRTDPKFYAPTAEQLLKEASYIAKKADGMLPSFFGKLPRQPYGVEAVPY